MNKTSISDEKRLVRGEQYIFTRRALRARDCIHTGAWRFLTVAGPVPREEIICIRELFRNAHITSVDTSKTNVLAAIEAGADEAFCCDLADFEINSEGYNNIKLPPIELAGKKFDVICLDLTGPASRTLSSMVSVYWRALAKRGVLIVTFSYGRDVVEAYQYEWEKDLAAVSKYKKYDPTKPYDVPSFVRALAHLTQIPDLPEPMMARINFVFGSHAEFLVSILQYSGKEMPMLSCLLQKQGTNKLPGRYMAVSEDDFTRAVTSDNLGNIYACPQDRILQLRRSLAARKAIATRKMRLAPQLKLFPPKANGPSVEV